MLFGLGSFFWITSKFNSQVMLFSCSSILFYEFAILPPVPLHWLLYCSSIPFYESKNAIVGASIVVITAHLSVLLWVKQCHYFCFHSGYYCSSIPFYDPYNVTIGVSIMVIIAYKHFVFWNLQYRCRCLCSGYCCVNIVPFSFTKCLSQSFIEYPLAFFECSLWK